MSHEIYFVEWFERGPDHAPCPVWACFACELAIIGSLSFDTRIELGGVCLHLAK